MHNYMYSDTYGSCVQALVAYRRCLLLYTILALSVVLCLHDVYTLHNAVTLYSKHRYQHYCCTHECHVLIK
jgi:hypothetical protein